MISNTTNADVYLDFNGLDSIRRQAGKDDKAALRQVGQQFEAIFVKMMLKSMRDASFGDPLFDSQNSKMYRDIYDHQLSLHLSKTGQIGLAEVLVEQLGKYLPEEEAAPDAKESTQALSLSAMLEARRQQFPKVTAPLTEAAKTVESPEVNFEGGEPQSFVSNLWDIAQKHAEKLGVDPKVLIAQAALETGWGKHVIQKADGISSYNLFNIKADQRWDGDRALVPTIEYKNGIARQEKANFRAYPSYEESFADYVEFIKNSPRYGEALKQSHDADRYVEELQQAGYATDPRYAEKIQSILRREPLASANTMQMASAERSVLER